MQATGKRVKASLKAIFVPLLLMGAATHAPMALAQSPGTFTATGDMTTPRLVHTATLLADGTVLIAGGLIQGAVVGYQNQTLSSAELYDPQTATFTATGDMTTPRIGHTATLLPDGKVLIAGGGINGNSVASAELYDPATKTFTPTGDMTMDRRGHAATVLLNGRILIVGGYSEGRDTDPTLISAELYDPSTGTFTRTGNMAGPGGRGATLLASGKVLITREPFIGSLTQYEIYDPSTGTFSLTGNPSARWATTATLLTNGNVLVAYGAGGPSGSGIAELYDPDSGIFTTTQNMTTAYRVRHTATLLSDGRVLLAGGCTCEWIAYISFFADAEIYDPATGTLGSTGSMHANRFGHTATLLNDGKVLIAGGWSFVGWVAPDGHSSAGRFVTLSSAELYTPEVLADAPVLHDIKGKP
jgi:Galactose oxidase, central domain/Kelch motif